MTDRSAPRITNNSPIARMRIERGLTQAQLAARIGVHKNRVCDWERGKFKPNCANLINLCAALECSMDDLIQ